MKVSRELAEEYGRGFSCPELTRTVQFAQILPEQAIVVTLSQQLSWSQVHALLPIKPPPGARLLRTRCAARNGGPCNRVT